MNYSSVSHCGNDHQEWLRGVEFYDIELDTLEKRLMELADKNRKGDVMAGIEHFQNQFIVQRNNIDELRHSINEHDARVASGAQAHAGRMDSGLVTDHENIGEQYRIFEKVMNDLRQEYNQFLVKWM